MSAHLLATFNTSKLNLQEYASLFSQYLGQLSSIDKVYQSPILALANKEVSMEQSELDAIMPNLILQCESDYKSDIVYENLDSTDHKLNAESYKPTGFFHSVIFRLDSDTVIKVGLTTSYSGRDSHISVQWPEGTSRTLMVQTLALLTQLTEANYATVTENDFWDFVENNTALPYGQVGWLSYVKSADLIAEDIEVLVKLNNNSAIVAISEEMPKAGDTAALSRLHSLYKHVNQVNA